jgi:hypothetical protein
MMNDKYTISLLSQLLKGVTFFNLKEIHSRDQFAKSDKKAQ